MRHFIKPILSVSLLVLGVVLVLFLGVGFWIGSSVRDHCQEMTAAYQQDDCVVALMRAVEDEDLPFGKRNSAVWALGQLGDERALNVLEKYYTANIPDREPWDGVLSQYELSKAINLLDGGFNITFFTWRQ
jgi:hypothetical protein